ncbi:small integral membrane protein 26-like [Callorhinus ursinus]|uniref:small integral membrane protein 26-like n=1 Tax=Callorhinus ursinus TaxID=34884 RepID=UPI003CD00CB9
MSKRGRRGRAGTMAAQTEGMPPFGTGRSLPACLHNHKLGLILEGDVQATSWYRRMSVVYAVGAWTTLGSMFYLGRKKRKPPGDEVEQKDVSRNEMLEPPKGFYLETIVTYKEDLVPVTEKILNFLKSWTGGPGREP